MSKRRVAHKDKARGKREMQGTRGRTIRNKTIKTGISAAGFTKQS